MLSVTLIGGVITAIGFWVFAPVLAENLLGASRLAPLLRAGSMLILFNALQGVYLGALQGFEAFKSVARVNWLGALLGAPLVVIGTLTVGLTGAVWGLVLQAVGRCVVCHVVLVKEASRAGVKISFGLSGVDKSLLWRFTLPTFMSNLLFGSANWVCGIILVRQPGGFRETALLSVAGSWRNLLIYLPATMGGVLLPMLSYLHKNGKKSEFKQLLVRNLWISAGVSVFLALPVCICSHWILKSYGPEFVSGTPIFVLTALMTTLVAVNNQLSRSMQASGHAWLDFSFNALWAITLVLTSLFLIPSQKGMGLAIAHALAAVALGTWQWLIIRRYLLHTEGSDMPPGLAAQSDDRTPSGVS